MRNDECGEKNEYWIVVGTCAPDLSVREARPPTLVIECRRMIGGLDPQRTRHYHPVLIHPQALDRRPPCWRQPLDSSCAINPAKMLAPILGAGIKQRHGFSRLRIWTSNSGCFAQIARRTGEAQIFEVIVATGINMLNMQRLADCSLASLTVLTAFNCWSKTASKDCEVTFAI
jgi:hypothetical protein